MKLLTSLIIIICSITLIYGNLHWKEKIENSSSVVAAKTKNETGSKQPNNVQETRESEMDSVLKEKLASLPVDVASLIEEAATNQKTIELLIVGSEANTIGNNPWTEIFQGKMEDAYGDLFHITIKEIVDTSSYTVINEGLHLEGIEKVPDLLILEPFLIKDNSEGIRIEQSIEHIEGIINDFNTLNHELHVFLQPAHPLHRGVFYPRDIDIFREYAEQEEYTYINHWENWPEDHASAELQALLIEGSDAPNDEGHRIWADYVGNLFINEE